MPRVSVKRTYLQMADAGELRPAPPPDPAPRIERLEECPPSFFRYLYAEVGRPYHWTDRLSWTDERVRSHLADRDVSLWLLSWHGSPAGYFELKRHEDDSVEIAYFGLLPEFTGRGWGKYLLTLAALAAWESGPRRVWLHTCTLDHPAALPNYVRRGFQPFREETYAADVPAATMVSAAASG
ncbi:MAG TPA: GNAT family N-acetyltransferase [Gemmatimonadales bacterium]|nr:GNAT family N-acetyltransferase [Gemmatimonadales bacterium]